MNSWDRATHQSMLFFHQYHQVYQGDTYVNEGAKTWQYDILRHLSSWMCPVTTTNSLPVVFRACSVHVPLCPSSWPPQKTVSICLASLAMTQHWLNAHTYTDTHFLLPYLSGGLAVSVPMVFSFLLILCVHWSEDLQMCLDSCFLYFHLDWESSRVKMWGKTKRLRQFCVSSRTSDLSLVLCYHIIALLDSIQRGMTEKNGPIQNTLSCKWKTFLHNRAKLPAFPPFCLPHLTHHSLLLLLFLNACILHCDTHTHACTRVHTHTHTHKEITLFVSHVLYRNLAQLFLQHQRHKQPAA